VEERKSRRSYTFGHIFGWLSIVGFLLGVTRLIYLAL
jgi:hypothetical protein